jgi:hypothetical protein
LARNQKERQLEETTTTASEHSQSIVKSHFNDSREFKRSASASGADMPKDLQYHDSQKNGSQLSDLLNAETLRLLEQVQKYQFPIFEFAEATLNKPLTVMAYHLIIKGGLLSKLKLPSDKFINFIMSIESGYRSSLAFHNSIHAADVLHGIYHLTQLEKISGTFSDLELLALYLAASIHDYDHPGVNNNFLIATRDKRAMFYNDKSVLENHHCAASFQVLLRDNNNFLETIDKKQYKLLRSYIVDMVLATDLAQHFDLLTRFKNKVLMFDVGCYFRDL